MKKVYAIVLMFTVVAQGNLNSWGRRGRAAPSSQVSPEPEQEVDLAGLLTDGTAQELATVLDQSRNMSEASDIGLKLYRLSKSGISEEKLRVLISKNIYFVGYYINSAVLTNDIQGVEKYLRCCQDMHYGKVALREAAMYGKLLVLQFLLEGEHAAAIVQEDAHYPLPFGNAGLKNSYEVAVHNKNLICAAYLRQKYAEVLGITLFAPAEVPLTLIDTTSDN